MPSEVLAYSDEKPDVGRAAHKLPDPTGFRLLIALPEVEEKTDGGIFVPEERRDAETVASIVGFVLKAGPDAYADKNRFPNGAWASEGDWVIFSPYTGVRISVHGQELRIINDDSVLGIVEDPRGVGRL